MAAAPFHTSVSVCGGQVCPRSCQHWLLSVALVLVILIDVVSHSGFDLHFPNWGQEEKGTTEDEMAGWHHQLDDGHEFG